MSSTCKYSSNAAPSMVSDTAIVMIIAMVIVTLRHSPVRTSDRTYCTRIGVWFPSQRNQADQDAWRRSAVDAARLVPHDPAALDLDDPPAHLVDDVGVVSDPHDRRAAAVDPVEQPHDLDRRVRVEVS